MVRAGRRVLVWCFVLSMVSAIAAVPAMGEDLNVVSGNLNLETGYSLRIGGSKALELGGVNNWSVSAGHGSGTGNYIVGIGYNALAGNTGSYNVAVGSQALKGNTGASCTGVGKNALYGNTGSSCLAIGGDALLNNTGTACTAIGTSALYNNAASGCIAIGHGALYGNASTGTYTIALGYQAGYGNTKSACVLIGYQAEATDNHQMVIGSDTTRGTIKNLYIGKGVWASAPTDVTIRATSSSTTVKGADLILAGGASTGGTPGRVRVLGEFSTPVLEITGGSDLAESFSVRTEAPTEKSEIVELLLSHGAKE